MSFFFFWGGGGLFVLTLASERISLKMHSIKSRFVDIRLACVSVHFSAALENFTGWGSEGVNIHFKKQNLK